MNDVLSRAQVEKLIPLTTSFIPTVDVGDGHVGVFSALLLMIEQDAALRAQLAAVEQERDSLVWTYSPAMAEARIHQLIAQLAASDQVAYDVAGTIEALKQQLAKADVRIQDLEASGLAKDGRLTQLEQERDELRSKHDYEWHEADAWMVRFHEANNKLAEVDRVIVTQCQAYDSQLMKAQARITGLEQQLDASKAGTCLKCHMGPLRESCAYPEACEHPGRDVALQLNRTLLDLAMSEARVTALETELRYLVDRHDESLVRSVTVDWGRAKAILTTSAPT